jgi:hypothetical protein
MSKIRLIVAGFCVILMLMCSVYQTEASGTGPQGPRPLPPEPLPDDEMWDAIRHAAICEKINFCICI